MFRFAIERGIVLTVGFLVLCLFGVIAVLSVPVQMTPNIDKPVISVQTYWPGATPADIEKEILIEQEEYLQGVRNLGRISSEASMGSAEIELEFNLGTNMEEALVLVNNALSQIDAYPENVDQPRLVSASSADDPFIFYSVSPLDPSVDKGAALGKKDFLEDNMGRALERIPGVARVNFFGDASRQVKIFLDPTLLAARQLSIQQVRQAIRARNRDISGGDITTGKRRYVVRTMGRFDSIEEIEQTIIAQRNGSPVRVADVGYAELGLAELSGKAYMGGERIMLFFLRREPGSNVIEVKEKIDAEIARLNRDLLANYGLFAEKYADDVGYVVAAVSVVKKNLAVGGLLACAVLFVFLRAVFPTLLGALGVPICAIGAFIGLLAMGRTVNVISLAGVAFALGMTLDNSIVVLENIVRHRQTGKTAFRASLDGVREVWKAVLASTLTTVFVFLPIALVDDEAGQLYSDIAIAISAAILMSMLVAITLIPSAAARLPFKPIDSHDMLTRFASEFAARLFKMLDWILARTMRQASVVLGTLVAAFLIIVFLTPQAEYLPEGEEPKIFAFMYAPPGYNLEEMDRVGHAIDKKVLAALALTERDELTPEGLPPLDYMIRLTGVDNLFTVSEPRFKDAASVEQLKQGLTNIYADFPGMLAFSNRGSIFSGNSGGTRAIELDISGPELAPIYEVASLAYAQAREAFESPQIRPKPGLTMTQPAVEVRPDWDRAQELGFNPSDLGYMIWALSDGAYVDEFFLSDDKIDMYLYSTEGQVENPEDIAELPVWSPSGVIVPLSSIARVEETVTANEIRRVDGKRTVTLIIVPPPEVALEQAVETTRREIIQKLHDAGQVPDGVSLTLSGASDKLASTRSALSGNFVIAVVLAYLLMVAIFSHWGYPLMILLSLPLGISGGLAGLWLMNNVIGVRMPLDMITMLGMVVLIGTVVNNPILLVEQARSNMHEKGMAVRQAITESVRMRLRPIMMSMLTTLFGLAPVVFLPGAGTELYRGLGTIVLFGLFFSTLLNLTFMPALLSLLLSRRRFLPGAGNPA